MRGFFIGKFYGIIGAMNNKVIWGIIALILLGGIIWFYSGTDESEGKSISFETVEWQDFYSGLSDEEDKVVKNQDEWSVFWNKAHSNLQPVPNVPPIDFGDNMIIVTSMGSRSTGGYNTKIEKIIDEGDSIKVFIKETSPGEGCIVSQAFTSPYHLVKIPLLDKSVNFETEQLKTSCE